MRGGDTPATLSRSELTKIVAIYAILAALTLAGFSASLAIGRATAVLAGLGAICYVLGLRHGVDADHIAAIDNTTRKLLQDGRRPSTVGTWFSLGHSTVVVGLIVGLVVATRAVVGDVPPLQNLGATVGTLVSGGFLWAIGLINVAIVLGLYRVFETLKEGKANQARLDDLLEKRGFMNRYFGSLFKVVKKPWQIYPIGVLFGLGFDTASEVALVAISVGIGVSTNVPTYYVLLLPLMFACGMVLVDTTDGVAMRLAYGWAFMNPLRKIYYNITVTVISVLVALAIGTVELLQVLATDLRLSGAFWGWLGALDFQALGLGMIAIFVLSWLVSFGYWRYGRFETKFAVHQPEAASGV
jgi:nickel/cobalt transporter (NiCoT) family protein